MKKLSLKALGATLLAAGLVVAGVAPAQAAATISVSSFTAGNAPGFTFSTGSASATAVSSFEVKIFNNSNQPTTFTPVSACATFSACNITSVKFGSTTWTQEGTQSGKTVAVIGYVAPNNSSQSNIKFNFSGTGLTLNSEAIEVVFAQGALTAPNSNGNYTAQGTISAQSFSSYTASVTVSGAPTFVSFYQNYSNQDFVRTTQSSVGQANLTLNTFTRSGYYFQGWATSSSGSVVYQDGELYSFAAPAQLYAVWSTTPPTPTPTPTASNNSSSDAGQTLATTGFDGTPYLYGGLTLAIVGSTLLLIARRKQNV